QCDKIDYIFGPNWNTKGGDLVTAFTTYTRNRLANGEEPSIAASRASEATGQQFTCYDRQELEAEIEFLRQLQNLEWGYNAILQQQQQLIEEIQLLRNDVMALVQSYQLQSTFPTS